MVAMYANIVCNNYVEICDNRFFDRSYRNRDFVSFANKRYQTHINNNFKHSDIDYSIVFYPILF